MTLKISNCKKKTLTCWRIAFGIICNSKKKKKYIETKYLLQLTNRLGLICFRLLGDLNRFHYYVIFVIVKSLISSSFIIELFSPIIVDSSFNVCSS